MSEKNESAKKAANSVVTGFLVIAGIAWLFGDKGSSEAAAPSPSPSASRSVAESVEPSPTPSSSADILRAAIIDGAITDQVVTLTFEEASGYLKVVYKVRDNLFSDSIEIGAWSDQADMIAAIRTTGIKVKKFDVVGVFPLVDNMGNEEDAPVISATYTKAIYKANLENLPGNLIMGAADDYWVHPELIALRK